MSVAAAPVETFNPFAGIRGIPGRFPAVLASVALALLIVGGIVIGADAKISIFADHREFWRRVILVCGLAIPATLAVALFGEARGWPQKQCLLWSVATLVPLIAVAVLIEPSSGLSHAGVWITLWSLPVFSPALARGKTNQAFWSLGYRSIACFAYGLLVACIVAIAISTTLGLADDLLRFRISGSAKDLIWAACLSIIAPMQVLARMPNPAEMPLDDHGPAWLHKLFNWLLAPASCAALLMLCAVVLESIIGWKLPDEDAVSMFAVLATACVGVWLAVFPLRDTGGRALRAYYRFFPWFMPLLAVLIAVFAITQIADSGVTISRYVLLVLSAWLAATAAYLLVSRAPKLVVPPTALAVMALAGAVGPWSANSVVVSSHLARLQAELDSSGYIVEGRLAPENGYADPAASRRIDTHVKHLRYQHGFRYLAGWLESVGMTIERKTQVDAIVAQMGVEHISIGEEKGEFAFRGADGKNFTYVGSGDTAVTGFEISVDLSLDDDIEDLRLSASTAGATYTVSYSDGTLHIADAENPAAVVRLDFADLARQLHEGGHTGYDWKTPDDLLVLDAQDNGLVARFISLSISGLKSGDAYEINRVKGILLVGGAGKTG